MNFTNPVPHEDAANSAAPAAISKLMTQLGVSGENEKSPPAPPQTKPAVARSKTAAAVPPLPANPFADYPSDPHKACQMTNPVEPTATGETLLETASDAEGNPQSRLPKVVKLTSDKVMFSTRSFQGMIYYLGETLRYEEDKDANSINFPRVLGRNPAVGGNSYFEIMFYGSSASR